MKTVKVVRKAIKQYPHIELYERLDRFETELISNFKSVMYALKEIDDKLLKIMNKDGTTNNNQEKA